MQRTFIAVAIASLVATCPTHAQDSGTAPARIGCKDGKLVALTVLVAEPGVITFQIPQDVCASSSPPQAPAAPASSPGARKI